MGVKEIWDDEQTSELIALKAQGKSYVEIAKIMNRDYDSVRNKYYRSFIRVRKESKNPKISWSKVEDDFLLQLARKLPRALIIKHYNTTGKEYGFRPRTPSSINWRLRHLGQGSDIKRGYYTRSSIATGLGFGEGRVNDWVRKGLPGVKDDGIIYIYQDDLVDWIVSDSKNLNGITEFGLSWFLELVRKVREGDRNANND